MKALSVKQPYASLIAQGIKTIETRLWFTAYRGELLIVSSKRPRLKNSGNPRVYLPTGQALAVLNVFDCRPMTKDDEMAAMCDLYPGAYAWCLNNIRPVVPFEVEGQLGLYEVPDVNFCRMCGFRIGPTVDYCGECICEEDGP